LGLRRSGGFVMATQNGFAFWQPETNEISYITDPEADKPLSRFNDGAVDRAGRFWAGSYGAKSNHLYRLDADLSVQRLASGLKIPNGIGWSPDNRYLYFTDSMKHKIYRYEFELETGQIRKRITWVDSEKQPGVPDGLTVDQEGNVWSARWDGWCIDVYNPAGRQIDKISVPVPRPTSICFGGPDLRTLYITSARGDLDDQVLNQAPLSGDLFRLEVEVQGLPEPLFVG
jgi:sugar lactone lactonase YvrE